MPRYPLTIIAALLTIVGMPLIALWLTGDQSDKTQDRVWEWIMIAAIPSFLLILAIARGERTGEKIEENTKLTKESSRSNIRHDMRNELTPLRAEQALVARDLADKVEATAQKLQEKDEAKEKNIVAKLEKYYCEANDVNRKLAEQQRRFNQLMVQMTGTRKLEHIEEVVEDNNAKLDDLKKQSNEQVPDTRGMS